MARFIRVNRVGPDQTAWVCSDLDILCQHIISRFMHGTTHSNCLKHRASKLISTINVR